MSCPDCRVLHFGHRTHSVFVDCDQVPSLILDLIRPGPQITLACVWGIPSARCLLETI